MFICYKNTFFCFTFPIPISKQVVSSQVVRIGTSNIAVKEATKNKNVLLQNQCHKIRQMFRQNSIEITSYIFI